MENKLVTYRNLKIGQRINGTQGNGCTSSFVGYVKAINPSYVTVEMWKKGGTEEKYSTDFLFMVEMTEEEFHAKYRKKAKEVMVNIQNKLHGDELGYHEMWNSWLFGSPYEIAKECIRNKIMVVGYSTDIVPKYGLLDADVADVGVCAEYEDGERFWCHYKMEYLNDMIERNRDLIDGGSAEAEKAE